MSNAEGNKMNAGEYQGTNGNWDRYLLPDGRTMYVLADEGADSYIDEDEFSPEERVENYAPFHSSELVEQTPDRSPLVRLGSWMLQLFNKSGN